MNLSATHPQSTGGLASPLRPPFSPQYNHNERLARHSALLNGQVSNSMIYINGSSSERLQLSRRSSLTHSSRTRRRRSHSEEHIDLDGPQVYACAKCRTHLTSHDEIISKSFHGRHGRAFLFDHCVNVDIGPAEERSLMTGLHSVCDIFCKRCKGLVGWTYIKAYEASEKYKEGKFVLEKLNLHLEASDHFRVAPPPGEKNDRFRARSISWGSDRISQSQRVEVYNNVDDSHSHRLDHSDSKQIIGNDFSVQYSLQNVTNCHATGSSIPNLPGSL